MTRGQQSSAEKLLRQSYFVWLLALSLSSSSLCLANASGFSSKVSESLDIVTYISPAIYGNSRRQYEADLIKLSLEKTKPEYGGYKMQAAPRIQSSMRDARIIKNKNLMNFVRAFSVDKDLLSDPDLIHIDFPIMRGSLGYRICFTSKANMQRLKKVTTLKELLAFTHVQGLGWQDTKILRHAGFNVTEAGQYASIFEMAARSRSDLFCRGIGEYLSEWKFFQPKIPDLRIDDTFVIFYPFPRYFFSHKDNRRLLKRIEIGLRKANEDGSFVGLWNQHHLEGIERANISSRKIYALENPFLNGIKLPYTEFFYPVTR